MSQQPAGEDMRLRVYLSLALFLLLITSQVFALEPEVELEKILVTNRRADSFLSQATENIEVLNAGKIEKIPAQNLSEVLKRIGAVDIQPRQGFGRATSISIQGCESRQVKMLIDGIPLNTQSSGQVNPAEFPVEYIKRIEVIKGAASSLWGSGLGGVINIVTKDTGKELVPTGSITSSFAEHRSRRQALDLAGAAGGLGYYLFSSLTESGGRGRHDDVLEKKAFGKISYDLKEAGKLLCSFGFSQADVNSGIYPDGSWDSQPYRDRYGKISWENNIGAADLKIEAKHFRKDIVTKYFATAEDNDAYMLLRFKDVLYQLSVSSSWKPRDKDLLVIGADFDCDNVKSDAYLDKAKTVRTQAPYLNYTLELGPWSLNAGARYDNNSEFGEALSPSLGAVYRIQGLPATLIRASVSRAFTAPPLLWKHNQNPNLWTLPATGLKPERAWVYELGGESELQPWLWVKLGLYRADIKDAIDDDYTETGERYKRNYYKFLRQGAELQLRWKLSEEFSFMGGAAFNDIKDKTTKQTLRGAGRPRQSFDAGFEYQNKWGLSIGIFGSYDRFGEPPAFEPNDRKMLWDMKISWENKHIKPFLNIYNLGNSSYWDDYWFPVPERYFEGGITIKW